MARQTKRLTSRFVETTSKVGQHADGNGLYLIVGAGGSKRWVFIFRWQGKQPEMGLGSFPTVSLSAAREAVIDARRLMAAGQNPIESRREARAATAGVVTFGQVANEIISSLSEGFRNEKHKAQWRNTLSTYAAALRDKAARDVDTADVLAVLQPIWTTKPETASRVRGRIERILDAAKAKAAKGDAVAWAGWTNPARWRGHLDTLLSKRKKLSRGHHTALPYADVPGFYSDLTRRQGLAALALRFTILTAARSGEVYGARWSEIDRKGKVWTVPPGRMKAEREHRVPLTDEMVVVLDAAAVSVPEKAERSADDLVFPGERRGGPLSVMAMLLRRMERGDITVHGFRSAFRDWAGNETHFAREIAEAALAHVIGDKAEQAYRRGDALEKRRALMTAWADFVTGSNAENNVVPITRSA